jgi:citrate lyase beta subunit
MLALRSLLATSADADSAAAASRSAADAVIVDLASPAPGPQRAAVRKNLSAVIGATGAHRRPVFARVSSASGGELAADIEAAVCPTLAAVLLAGTEAPQDARDADVLLRKHELRHEMMPGAVRLIPEIDSAAGLQALPAILEAVDRHEAVALNTALMHRDLGLGHGLKDAHDHTMAMVAVAARAAELPWVLGTFGGDHGFIEATRAHEFGAAGATIRSEASARGVNSLFAPDASRVAIARAALREWDRLRADGAMNGTVLVGDEADPRIELVDRRAIRAARLVVAHADAVAARERVRD